MSIRTIIDWAIEDANGSITGTVASPFYQYFDTVGNWCWACDVDIGGSPDQVLIAVPVASNNVDVIYAQQGKAVNLSRLGNGKYVITGLAKSLNSTTHYIFMTFTDEMYMITRDKLSGFIIRPLTYGELGTLVPPYGYGALPYGAQGKFQADGTFVEIVESY